MNTENIYKALERAGAEIVAEMANIIKKNNAVASGNLLKSLTYDVTVDSGVWGLVIEYADYGRFVDKGRNPGRFPPKKDIENWMRLKGIPQSALWPIMWKIKKGGFYSKKVGETGTYTPIKGIHFTDPFSKNVDLQNLKKYFGEALAASVRTDIIDELKSIQQVMTSSGTIKRKK
jgi:hypothetical protein